MNGNFVKLSENCHQQKIEIPLFDISFGYFGKLGRVWSKSKVEVAVDAEQPA